MNWFKNMKVGLKLYVGFGVVIAIAAVMGFMSLDKLSGMNDRITSLAQVSAEKVKLCAGVNQNLLEINRAEKNLILAKTQEKRDEYAKFIATIREEMQDRLDPLRELADETDKAKLDEFTAKWDKYLEVNKQVEDYAKLNSNTRAKALSMGDAEASLENLEKALEAIGKKNEADFDKAVGKNNVQLLVNANTKINLSARLLRNAVEYQRAEKNLILSTTQEEMDEFELYIENIDQEIEAHFAQLRELVDDEGKLALGNARSSYEKFRSFDDEIRRLSRENGNAKAFDLSIGESRALVGECQTLIDKIIEKNDKTMSDDVKANSENYAQARIIVISLLVISLVSGLAIAFFIAQMISKPVTDIAKAAEMIADGDIEQKISINTKDEIGGLADSFRKLINYMKELANVAENIAQNDLTVKVTPKSEKDVLGNSFKTMIYNLSAIITQLGGAASEVASASAEVSASAEQISRGAENQEQQVSQVTVAMEEMTATIVESSRNANDASDGSKSAADTAGDGGQIVSETIEGMSKISQVVSESVENIDKLATSAEQIGEIIGVIDDVADQTNLLALNAAIEAARAGEHGRGFAVVADEVRKLAERTGKATGEITDMIKGIQEGTKVAVASMKVGTDEINSGRELADKAGNSLNEVVSGSQRVMDMIQQIATATEEQSAAAEQISKNIEQVSLATKESAAGAEQAATASEELSKNAEGLQQIVARFKVSNDSLEKTHETASAE
ncbi:MAG: hypothetical protein DRP35_09080 [Candidatus Zixiibacteriota bacterium]|nr:MAG: hypothetical protein DRP35_09080 [candidate division Zixibacteria bacterium]